MIKKIDLENHFYDISSVEALQARKKGDYPYWEKESNTITWVEGVSMCQNKFYDELLDFSEKRLKTMDELGIQTTVHRPPPQSDFFRRLTDIPICMF